MRIEANDAVDGVMRRWPATIRVFIRHHLHCVGCGFGPFCTIEEACAAHKASLPDVLADLRRAARPAPRGIRACRTSERLNHGELANR